MYKIHTFKEKYQIYEMIDTKSNSCVKIAPERGGIVTGFKSNGQELLYIDVDTFTNIDTKVKGGIPILFPICGRLEDNEYTWNGIKYKMGIHGFVRDYPWQVIEKNCQNKASLKLRYKSNEFTKNVYPFDFEIILDFVLKDGKLTIHQEYYNHSYERMPAYGGFHPYFKIKDKNDLKFNFKVSQYLDYLDMKVRPYTGEIKLPSDSEVNLIFNVEKNEVSFIDLGLERKVCLEYGDEFKYIVLWLNGKDDFLCLEPWMAKSNALNTGNDIILIEPGGRLKTYLTIYCKNL